MSSFNMSEDLIDFEKMVDDIRDWLHVYGKDPRAGQMLLDFLNGNCAHDFTTKNSVCELCGAIL